MSKIKGFTFFLLLTLLFHKISAHAIECTNYLPINEAPKMIVNKDIKIQNIKYLSRGTSNEALDLYHEKEAVVEVFSHDNTKIYLTEDDIYLMSQVVFSESHGEPYEGKVAVASVILNRLVTPSFPSTVEGVITQKNAFSCVKNGTISSVPDRESYAAVIDAIKGYDPTNQALYFYNPKTATCSWMKQIEKKNVKEIGRHVFFQIKK